MTGTDRTRSNPQQGGTMTLYHVHIYREVRQLFRNVEADSPEEAARMAADLPPQDASFSEDCDGETFGALVDVAGDDEFTQSVMIDFEAGRLLNAARAFKAAIDKEGVE